MKLIRVTLLLLAFALALPSLGLAQWQLDGAAISTAVNYHIRPTIVPDGAGGAIITWDDYRSGSSYDIYVQRVNASGVPQWTANGVALCTAAYSQYYPTIVSDGAGGAIVTWFDLRSGGPSDIYAQRVNSSGVPQWTANGLAVCTAGNDQSNPTIASDGAGGAIVTWNDYRNGVDADIYAQRVSASGVPQWTADGVALCTAGNYQLTPMIVSDGAGGAIVTWGDFRGGVYYDVYAQRVNASGVPQWTANGVALCTADNQQNSAMIVSDGAGGAIVTWSDYRNNVDVDIYAQRVSASGVPQWTANGVALSTAGDSQFAPVIASDDAGGAIVAWADYRSGIQDIYAQRVSVSGVPQWTPNGVALCTAIYQQYEAAIVSDGAGGAIVAWFDVRSGISYDIYAQRVSASGVPQWTANGVPLCTAGGTQQIPTIASDGKGGAIVTWEDYRSGGSPDIYAQRVEADFGAWGRPEALITSVSDISGDQGGRAAVNWLASGRDQSPQQVITHYSVWRAVDPAALSARARTDPELVDAWAIGPDFQGTAIRHQRIATTDYYWEWVANQTFRYSAGYSISAATREDSTAADPAVHYFQVLAHTSDPFVYWQSNVMSGHSVDNLAPAAPLWLTAQRSGGDVNLKWNRVNAPDLHNYSVYRTTSSGVTPIPTNFLASATDTVLVDADAPATALYYIAIAADTHQNRSGPSNEAGVAAATGVGRTPAITALTVLQNHPNPFAGTTTLDIGLPMDSDLEIEIFDVAGRKVRDMRHVGQKAGWGSVAFDGRDDASRALASGVYFFKVSANGTTITRKMVIAR